MHLGCRPFTQGDSVTMYLIAGHRPTRTEMSTPGFVINDVTFRRDTICKAKAFRDEIAYRF